jgi:hypothetical protein
MDTRVDISLFKDAYEALRMLASDVRALTQIPKARRDEAIKSIADAYQVLDLGTSLVIARLGKVIERGDIGDDRAFAIELAALQSAQEWFEMESRVALCSTLRVHRQELRRTFSGTIGRASMKDWTEADRQMAAVLDHEGVLANHITSTLIDLSSMAGPATKSKAGFKRALKAVKAARDGLVAQRREYIGAEVELLQAV